MDSKISIILPTLNRGIKCCSVINMMLNQSINNFELIIIDDGSSSDQSLYITNYLTKLNNNKILYFKNNTNLGISKSLNIGLSKISGDFITWISDDNFYYSNFLSILSTPLSSHDFSYSAYDHQHINGDIVKKTPQFKNFNNLLNNFDGCASFMWNKSIINKIGKYNNKLHGTEDYDYLLRTLYLTNKIHYSDISTMKYILHDQSLFITKMYNILTEKNELVSVYRLITQPLSKKYNFIIYSNLSFKHILLNYIKYIKFYNKYNLFIFVNDNIFRFNKYFLINSKYIECLLNINKNMTYIMLLSDYDISNYNNINVYNIN